MEKRYRVTGRFEGKEIDETVDAVSKAQARLIAMMKSGFNNRYWDRFKKSREIRVRMVK